MVRYWYPTCQAGSFLVSSSHDIYQPTPIQ
nr:MAG TPA: hypothetical protein [Caudoviricetes sp.]